MAVHSLILPMTASPTSIDQASALPPPVIACRYRGNDSRLVLKAVAHSDVVRRCDSLKRDRRWENLKERTTPGFAWFGSLRDFLIMYRVAKGLSVDNAATKIPVRTSAVVQATTELVCQATSLLCSDTVMTLTTRFAAMIQVLFKFISHYFGMIGFVWVKDLQDTYPKNDHQGQCLSPRQFEMPYNW